MTDVPVATPARRGRLLAPMQRPLWASQRRHPDSPLQNMPLLSRFGAPIDAERLVAAFARVVEASDALRTRIVEERGTPVVHLQRTPVASELIDLPTTELGSWSEQRARRPIDLTIAAYDSVVLRHEDGTTSWYLALHHAVTDATSSALVFSLTAESYESGKSPAIGSYYDWADRIELRGGARFDQALARWRDRPKAPGVGRLYQRVRSPRPEAERIKIPVSAELADRAQARLATDFAMVSPDLAWTALLVTLASLQFHRLARVDRFSIGVPVHNRGDAVARGLVGPVMEVFPVDIEVMPADTFRTLHRRVGRALMQTLRHAVPGTAPAGDYEAVVNVIPRAGMDHFGAIPTVTHWVHSGATESNHLFRLQMTAYGDGPFELVLDVNEAASRPEHRRRAGAHTLLLLEAMLTDPDRSIDEREVCTPDELEALRAWEYSADFEGPTDNVVDRLHRALAASDLVVLEDGEQSWTGAELWARVLDMAAWLAERGVHRGERVGIELPRSSDAVIAILATLVAGASYVPLDPDQPVLRRRRLAERAGCRIVLDALPDNVDRAGGSTSSVHSPDGTDEAYLLFTSGSSGEPKGVPITHGALARYVRFAEESYAVVDQPFVAPLFSALTFDLTVTSIFVPLISGGRLIVIRPEGVPALAEVARRTEITWCKATPSHLEILERLLPDGHRLSVLVVGGEAFGAGLAQRLTDRLPGVRIFNEYGPTEAVVGCMIHEAVPAALRSEPDVPIGRPAPGVTLRIVDDSLGRVPIGAPGELLIAHEGLTAGYLDGDRRPFVELDGRRFYRSGDLVRLCDDETCVYLGRIDEQVKVGGIRLEPTEVESALVAHPAISRAAVRLWAPVHVAAERHCVRCGLASNVPGVRYDEEGVCDTCRLYERIAPVVASWFKTLDDLRQIRDEARASRTGAFDCVALLSGGKDSTYALYQLVALGFEPYALTLDNGFLSDQAKENIRRTVADLGVTHEFVTPSAMNQIFADSLERYSNVCNGCFKTIYTVATTKADELGAPLVVTGLSRGQLFETRLVPQQFSSERFDPDAIDRAVLEARKVYHRVDDGPNRLLDTSVFATDDVFERIQYIDFYRYVDVELAEMLRFLDDHAPWVRPTDTGRSTNCRINDAGIHTHLLEQGFHNYAVPYAWDVRLGHKVRETAMDELDDRLDPAEVDAMLDAVGYRPAPRQVLTAWFELSPDHDEPPSPAELRAFLGQRLATHAIPSAFVRVLELPVTTNGKLDTRSLPAPERVHRSSPALYVSPVSPMESVVVAAWEHVLRLEPIGVDDDFFNIGGDSLAAIEMIVMLSERLGRTIREELAFLHTTPRALAAAIEAGGLGERTGGATPPPPVEWETPPPLTVGEQSILYDQEIHPGSLRYNVGHIFHVDGSVEVSSFARALRSAVARHVSLSWTYGSTRRPVSPEQAVTIESAEPCGPERLRSTVDRFHRVPFDLEAGPLLRVLVQPVTDGTTAVVFSIHHVCGDAESFLQLWDQVDDLLADREPAPLATDTIGFDRWLQSGVRDVDRDHWRVAVDAPPVAHLTIAPTPVGEPDGFLRTTARFGPDALRIGTGASAFSVALAALTATLRRYSDGERIGVGVITSNRVHRAAEPLVGYLLNTLPVELSVCDGVTLRSLTADAAAVVGRMLAHRAYPLAHIVSDRREAGSRQPVIDVLLAFHELRPSRLGRHHVRHEVLFNGEAVADATFFVELHGDRVDLAMEYRGTVMTEQDAAQLLRDFEAMLVATIESVGTRLPAVSLPSDRSSRLDGGPAMGPKTVLDAIETNFAAAADASAVTCGSESITWAELGRRSADLAADLIARGVSVGDRVVVALPRSVDLLVAIVGVLRAGAAYVPIDPAYPDARIRLIATKSGAAVSVVADRHLELTLISVVPAEVGRHGAPGLPAVGPESGAYVMFTSGSTGTPRGVLVDHARLAASTGARDAVYDGDPGRFLVVSSLAFDSSVAGVFWTLATGGELVLPTEAEVHDPDALSALLASVTHTLMVPTLYEALLERGSGAATWPSVVAVAGEACPARLVRRHRELRSASRLFNEYGPTEATVWATAHRCEGSEEPVPIGRPVPGAWVDVVDPTGRSLPAGVAGELVVGGIGVADGYLDDLEATNRRFGTSPSGERWFRTGDRAAVRNGVAHFLGRIDHQLNVGGVRAEPEEIERVLGEAAHVGAVIVTASDPRSLDELISAVPTEQLRTAMAGAASADDPADALAARLRDLTPGHLRLVAHLEADGTEPIDLPAVRERARQSLPPLLRPSSMVVHPRLPRTPNGKLDRDAVARLPAPVAAIAPVTSGSGSDDRMLVAVRREFALVLGRDQVGDDDSFFDIGGHSLLALELVTRLQERLGQRVTVATLYDTATPARLAARMRSWGGAVEQYQFLVPIQPKGSKPPIYGIHVLGENATFFRPLAAELGDDQPMFGLGLIDEASSNRAPTDVGEVCRRYADELERNTPTGPVVLASVSIGSVAAIEVARLLRERGRDVPVLVLFDAAGPDADQFAPTGFERVRMHGRLIRRAPVDYVRQRVDNQLAVVVWRLEQAELALRTRFGRRVPERLRQRRFVEENIASARHIELGSFDGRVIVIRAGDEPFTEPLAAHGMGWSRLFPQVEVVTSPGGHLSMLQPPHVSTLATHLRF